MTAYVDGDRRTRISLSTNIGFALGDHGVPSNLLNGSATADWPNAVFPNNVSSNADQWFEFNLASPKIWDGLKVFQIGTPLRGTYKGQAWNGSAWVDYGPTFQMGGAEEQELPAWQGNTTPYSRYRLLGMGGPVSDGTWMTEWWFKEAEPAQAPPPPVRWLTNLARAEFDAPVRQGMFSLPTKSYIDAFTSPPYKEVRTSALMSDCRVGDLVEVTCTQELTWDNNVGKDCECAAFLMLRRSDEVGDVFMPNAGPGTDIRCLSENAGKNVIRLVHHDQIVWIGKMLSVPAAGAYRVALMMYANKTAELPTDGEPIYLHDGDMKVTLWRGTEV